MRSDRYNGRFPRWRGKHKGQLIRTLLLKMQNGCCAICGRSLPNACAYYMQNCGGQKSGIVDHDHKTGFIRGLLCASCNKVLGEYEWGIMHLTKARPLKRLTVLPRELDNAPFSHRSDWKDWCRADTLDEAMDLSFPDISFVWNAFIENAVWSKDLRRLFDKYNEIASVCPSNRTEELVGKFSGEVDMYVMENYVREREDGRVDKLIRAQVENY